MPRLKRGESISYDEVSFWNINKCFSSEESSLFVSLWSCGGKKSGPAHLHVPFHREHQKAFAELTSMLVCTGVSVFGPSLLFLWLPLFCSFWSNLPPFLLRMPPLHLWVRKSMCILCLCDSDSGSWENALKHPLDISR